MRLVPEMIVLKQELASLQIMKTTANLVTPGSGLVLPERNLMTILVETRQWGGMNTLGLWDTSWFSEKKKYLSSTPTTQNSLRIIF